MGCTVAMALLALCAFSPATEPVSPHAMAGTDRPAQDGLDARERIEPQVGAIRTAPAGRGRILVRTRG